MLVGDVFLRASLTVVVFVIFGCLVTYWLRRRKIPDSSRATRLLLILIGVGLILQFFGPSKGAGMITYTQAAQTIVSQGVRVYSVFPNSEQPEVPPLNLIVLSLLYLVSPAQLWASTVAAYQLLINAVIAYVVARSFSGNTGLFAATLVIFNPYFFVYSILNITPDQPMLGLALVAFFLLSLGRTRLSFVFFGLALVTMQTAIFFVIPVYFYVFFTRGLRASSQMAAVVAIIFVAFSLPFALVDNAYMNKVWFAEFARVGLAPQLSLYNPNFAGLSTYLAYVHDLTGADLRFVYAMSPLVFGLVTAFVVYLIWRNPTMKIATLSLLALMPFYLATWNTAYGGNPVNPWRLYYFIPFATIIWLRETGMTSISSLLSILSVQLYRLSDVAAYVTGTDYLILGNLAVPALLLTFFAFEARRCLKSTSRMRGPHNPAL